VRKLASRFAMVLIGALLFRPVPAEAAKPSPFAPFVGEWVGMGWGWEVRFEETRHGFARQVLGGGQAGGSSGEALLGGKDGVLMMLTVEHLTRYHFLIAPDGTAIGVGSISYNLNPNLCGVAALTAMVNERVNALEWMPLIYKAGREIGEAAIKRSNAKWLAEEGKLAEFIDEFRKANPVESLKKYQNERDWVWAMDTGLVKGPAAAKIEDASDFAAALIRDKCTNPRWLVAGKIDCATLMGAWPANLPGEKLQAAAGKGIADVVLEVIGNKTTDKMKELLTEAKREEALCSFAHRTRRAGAQIGPKDWEEVKAALLAGVPEAALDVFLGKDLPTGFVLSIPGVTQVQYFYKGLVNGPEHRMFKIKGRLVPSSAEARLHLEMDGEVSGGPKDLTVEYAVNYKTDRAQFPSWTPFLEGPGIVKKGGTVTVREPKIDVLTRTVKDPKTGKDKKIRWETRRTEAHDIDLTYPFATFHEAGTQRNGVKVWHEYEYYWDAFKLLEPKDAQ